MGSSIEELLNELSNTTSGNINEWCDKFCEYYAVNGRHSYSEITKYLLNNDGGIEYMNRIVPELEKVRDAMPERSVKISITKLIDHINLEIIRYSFLYDLITDTVAEKYIELNNERLDGINQLMSDMQKQTDSIKELLEGNIAQSEQLQENLMEIHKEVGEAQELSEAAKKLSEDARKLSKKAKEKVESAQKESITILGIFASIAVAFTGGMIFTSSVLENISKASAYRVIIVALIIGFVLINTVIALVLYLNHIVHSAAVDREEKFFDKLKKAIGKNIFWIVTDAIVIALIWATYSGWERSSEKALHDKSNSYNIEKLNKEIDDIIHSVSGN